MRKSNIHPVVKTAFLFAIVMAGIVFAVVLAYDFQNNGVIWPASQYTGIAWVACAIVLCLIVVFFLRITKVNWFWSIVGGAIAIVIYSVFITVLFDLLESFVRGWLFG